MFIITAVVLFLASSISAFAQKIPKTKICHNGNTIIVDNQAVLNAHLAHGDYLGECTIDLPILPGFAPIEKSTEVVSIELESLASSYGTSAANPLVYTIDGASDRVLVEIVVVQGQLLQVQNLLAQTYGIGTQDYINVTPNNLVITVYFEISRIPELNQYPQIINEVRASEPPLPNIGAVTSEGDELQGSLLGRIANQLDGTGIKIGVLSDTYNAKGGAAQDIANGDLPGAGNPFGNAQPVEVLLDNTVGVDEGRAMMHLVHDVAPGATLAFRTGFRGAGDFAAGIEELAAAGCDVIVDDITYYKQYMFSDALVAQTVNTVSANGVVYITSAGNFGTLSQEGVFNPVTVDGVTVNQFTGNDHLLNVTAAPGRWVIVLQWDDAVYSETGSGTTVDLDMALALDDGTNIVSLNKDNLGLDPVEVCPFIVSGTEPQSFNIKLINASGSEQVQYKLIVYGGLDFTFNETDAGTYSSTITGHANAPGAISVGAVFDPVANGVFEPTIEAFSSRGGLLGRQKPDISAPNRTSTNVEGFEVFAGTSAAAPHVAGAAALVLEAARRDQLSVDVRTVLTQTTDPMPGASPLEAGAGFMRVDRALSSLTEPVPVISGISFDQNVSPQTVLIGDAGDPGYITITITVDASYVSDNAVIYLREEALTTEVTIDEATNTATLTAVVKAEDGQTTLLGNPELFVYNPGNRTTAPQSSDTVQLFDAFKEVVQVVAQDAGKFYGELPPDYAFILQDDGDPGIPGELADILSGYLGYNVPDVKNSADGQVNFLSDVNKYSIIPYFAQELPAALTEIYEFEFVSATLTINKIDLVITPQGPQDGFVYCQPITGFEYQYKLGVDGVVYNFGQDAVGQIIENVQQEHEAGVLNGTALVNLPEGLRNGTALVNIDGGTLEAFRNGTAFVNFNFLITENALTEALKNGTALVNVPSGVLRNENNELTDGYPLGNGTALVNVPALLNGTALVNFPSGPLRNGTALVNMPGTLNGTALVNTPALRNAEGDPDPAYDNTILIFAEADNEPVPEGQDPPLINLFALNWVTGNSAGSHFVVSGTYDSKNFNTVYAAGEFTVHPALLQMVIDQPEPVEYGVSDPEISYTITGFGCDETEEGVFPEGISFSFGENFRDVGEYEILPVFAEPSNYTLSHNQVILTVQPADLVVSVNSIPTGTVAYGDPEPLYTSVFDTFRYDDDEASVFSEGDGLVYSLDQPYGPAGTYTISVSYSGEVRNYDVTYEVGQLVVDKAPLQITIDDKYIRFGELLPEFTYTASIASLTQNEIFDLAPPELMVPAYDNVGAFPIVLTGGLSGNYELTVLDGVLTVGDPANNVKKLQPYLDCVRDNVGGGMAYTAYFSVDNRNSFELYIPEGDRNEIVGMGTWTGSIPTNFAPGTTTFAIDFDGSVIDYFLISGKGNQSSSTGTSASSGSNKCPADLDISARIATNSADANLEDVQSESMWNENLAEGYPNPTDGHFVVRINRSASTANNLLVLDAKGRVHTIMAVHNTHDNTIELDFTGLNKGIYFVRLDLGEDVEVLRIVKQ
jgi:hypothetical protein